jgi:hypothetical protein
LAAVQCRLHIHELCSDALVLSDLTTGATHLPSGLQTLNPRRLISLSWTA